jgi:hypothetical protein
MPDDQHRSRDLRDRLSGLLADWAPSCRVVLKELEEKRARLDDAREPATQATEQQAAAQAASRAGPTHRNAEGRGRGVAKLRQRSSRKDLEFERLSSELDSKKELIRALRRDAESSIG